MYGPSSDIIGSAYVRFPPNCDIRRTTHLALHPRDVPHLASGPRFALAVDVNVGAALAEQLVPALDIGADEVVHDGAATHQAGQARRKIADGADVLLEL